MKAFASVAALALIAGGTTAAVAQPAAGPPPAGTPAPTTGAPGDPADAAAALQAAAAETNDTGPAVYDPLEGFNRAMWGLNMGLDKVLIKPVSTVYRTIAPRPVRRGLSHVLSNLSEPFSAINALLQGKADRAFNSLGRFIVNTTIGVGGLADQASRMGLKPTPEDFGQTLAKWGVKSGPYLVLPLLGPSSFRDGVGTGVAFVADPYRIALNNSGLSSTERWGISAFTVVSARSDLTDSGADTFLKTSLDPYAAARSAYAQRREQAIRDEDGGSGPATGGGAASGDDAALKAAVDDLKTEQGASDTPEATPAAPAAPPPPEAPTPETPPSEAAPSETPMPETPAVAPTPTAAPEATTPTPN